MSEAVEFADGLLGDVATLQRRVQHLQEDRARRSRIDQAVGILMHRYGLDGFAASRTLLRWSRVVDLPLEALADAVVTVTVSDDARAALPREVAHTVSRLLRRELAATTDRELGVRSVTRRR